jgi:hypothetical protein
MRSGWEHSLKAQFQLREYSLINEITAVRLIPSQWSMNIGYTIMRRRAL